MKRYKRVSGLDCQYGAGGASTLPTSVMVQFKDQDFAATVLYLLDHLSDFVKIGAILFKRVVTGTWSNVFIVFFILL